MYTQTTPDPNTNSTPTITIRPATLDDAHDIAAILVEAFPSLYEWTFGRLGSERLVRLLIALYRSGNLDYSVIRLAATQQGVEGLAIWHMKGRVGKGPVRLYYRTLRSELGRLQTIRAFLGGILTNLMISVRIPEEDDLLYIEALAVRSTARGCGLGTALLQNAIDWGTSNGRPRLALHVLQRNADARRLYSRMGFALQSPEPPAPPANSKRGQWVSLLMVRPPDPPAQKSPSQL